MNTVAREATHVASVVLPTPPVTQVAIAGVTLETRFASDRCRQVRWIAYIPAFAGTTTGFSVLFTVGMADVAVSCSRIFQEFCTFAMSFLDEGFHNGIVAAQHAAPSYLSLLNRLPDDRRLTKWFG
jgi:hypothetical protein